MNINLTKKYRLIWDVSSRIIQNDYEMDYSGTITSIVTPGDVSCFESEILENILDKIIMDQCIVDLSLDI